MPGVLRGQKLWRCPRCGHRFVTPNMWHSCTKVQLAAHFRGKDPLVRKLFDRLLATARRNGPVTVVPQKTRIAFMVRVRFGGATIRRHWIDAGLWLTRRATHPALVRYELIPPRAHLHYFRFSQLNQMDRAFVALMREAYSVGRRQHLNR